jgi:exodeoxyribonuclease-1
MILPIAASTVNPNSVVCFDLMQDPLPLIEAVKTVHATYCSTGKPVQPIGDQSHDPQENAAYSALLAMPGIVRVAVNKVPFLSPTAVLTDAIAQRLELDRGMCERHHHLLQSCEILALSLQRASNIDTRPPKSDTDVDSSLYTGLFFSDADYRRFAMIRSSTPEQLWKTTLWFDDPRAQEMLWRYLCRNWPQQIASKETERWKSFCSSRLLSVQSDDTVNLAFYQRKIAEKMSSKETTPAEMKILSELDQWGRQLCARLGIAYPDRR